MKKNKNIREEDDTYRWSDDERDDAISQTAPAGFGDQSDGVPTRLPTGTRAGMPPPIGKPIRRGRPAPPVPPGRSLGRRPVAMMRRPPEGSGEHPDRLPDLPLEGAGSCAACGDMHAENSACYESAGAGGAQMPLGSKLEQRRERLKEMIRQAVREIVRKKEGGGGYVLYGPNKGKKKNPKPAGEFPTRLAAKRAELARFPPKDADQLKKARKRIDKLSKDPKKRADAERRDLTGRKPIKKAGKATGDRKKARREALLRRMVQGISERLFREEEIAGSPWDSRISNLHPDAISADRRLAALHKKMHQNSAWSLEDAHKGLTKILRGTAKVMPGEIAHDENRQKMYCPCMLDVDGTEIGPVHFYIDGGHVRCEVSQDARAALAEMDPDLARDLRGSLMTYQEDHLPKITHAKDAWDERDSYLDKLHAKLDKHVGGMSPVEVHLAKQLLARDRGKK